LNYSLAIFAGKGLALTFLGPVMKFIVYLDLTGWFEVGTPKSNFRTWESVTTENLSLEIRLPPLDMPELGNLDVMRRYYRNRMRRVRAALVSCDCISLGDLYGLKTVFKAPAGTIGQ
jgi:hypothetical protein